MEYRPMTVQKLQSGRWLTWGIRFFLTAALTASKTPGGYAPFALGCVAAAGPGGSGLAALAGAGVGAVLFLDFADALPFLATAVLIFTTSTALRGIWLEKKRWFPAAVGVALFLAVGGIYVIQSLDPLGHVTDWAAAAILLGAAAWYDLPLLQAGQEHLDPDSLLVLGASLQWQGVRDNRTELVWTVLLKQVIIPLVMLGLAVLLGFRNEALGVMLILFGAPCAISSYPMAEAMGGDGPLAASQVVLTTLCSMGTLFVLVYVGKLFAWL